jgi:hypothetical protein
VEERRELDIGDQNHFFSIQPQILLSVFFVTPFVVEIYLSLYSKSLSSSADHTNSQYGRLK